MKIGTKYPELATWDAIDAACREFHPRRYLEIGVREGNSLLIALSATKLDQVALVDNWGGRFGGTNRGNHGHIERYLSALKFGGSVTYLDGNSKEMLPKLNGRAFDLALVDADHTAAGAAWDAAEAWEMLSAGGVMVFDDIAHPDHADLLPVWEAFLAERLEATELFRVTDRPYGVAAARKGGA
jgi:hypothetical protein